MATETDTSFGTGGSLLRKDRIIRWGLSAAGVVFVITVWELYAEVFDLVDHLVLPSPTEVLGAYREFWPLILENTLATLYVGAFGFAAALLIGIVLALVFIVSETLDSAFMPLMVAGNTVPRITLAPLIIFYFGGVDAKYIIAAWVAMFPMFMNAYEGFGSIGEENKLLLQSFDATILQELRYVRLPNAVPFLFDGMKVTATLSFVGAIVGEYVASETGLGYLVVFAMWHYQIPLVVAIVSIMGVVSTVIFLALFVLQDRVIFWKETSLFE